MGKFITSITFVVAGVLLIICLIAIVSYSYTDEIIVSKIRVSCLIVGITSVIMSIGIFIAALYGSDIIKQTDLSGKFVIKIINSYFGNNKENIPIYKNSINNRLLANNEYLFNAYYNIITFKNLYSGMNLNGLMREGGIAMPDLVGSLDPSFRSVDNEIASIDYYVNAISGIYPSLRSLFVGNIGHMTNLLFPSINNINYDINKRSLIGNDIPAVIKLKYQSENYFGKPGVSAFPNINYTNDDNLNRLFNMVNNIKGFLKIVLGICSKPGFSVLLNKLSDYGNNSLDLSGYLSTKKLLDDVIVEGAMAERARRTYTLNCETANRYSIASIKKVLNYENVKYIYINMSAKIKYMQSVGILQNMLKDLATIKNEVIRIIIGMENIIEFLQFYNLITTVDVAGGLNWFKPDVLINMGLDDADTTTDLINNGIYGKFTNKIYKINTLADDGNVIPLLNEELEYTREYYNNIGTLLPGVFYEKMNDFFDNTKNIEAILDNITKSNVNNICLKDVITTEFSNIKINDEFNISKVLQQSNDFINDSKYYFAVRVLTVANMFLKYIKANNASFSMLTINAKIIYNEDVMGDYDNDNRNNYSVNYNNFVDLIYTYTYTYTAFCNAIKAVELFIQQNKVFYFMRGFIRYLSKTINKITEKETLYLYTDLLRDIFSNPEKSINKIKKFASSSSEINNAFMTSFVVNEDYIDILFKSAFTLQKYIKD